MARYLCMLPLILILVAPHNAIPQTTTAPADATAANPVHPTPQMLDHARMLFSIDCAMCHGAHGDGKGDLVSDMKLAMKDWTASPSPLDALKDGELYSIIKDGKDKMPPEGSRAQDAELWTLVIYVRSLAKK